MKVFTTLLLFVAFALIVINIMQLDFDRPFEGNSLVALIGIVASFCAVFILLIFKISKKIQDKMKNQ
jgi:hypothetical protein